MIATNQPNRRSSRAPRSGDRKPLVSRQRDQEEGRSSGHAFVVLEHAKTVGGTVRHFYSSDQWQVLEERVDAATTADKQYVWGQRYVDDLVLFDKGSTRHYSLQDANWNVVAMTDDTGTVAERYAYTPYGVVEFLTSTFGSRSSSAISNEYLYTDAMKKAKAAPFWLSLES